MFGNVDGFAASQLRFHLFGEHRGGGEATDQLLAAFRTLIVATLIGQHGEADVAIAAGDEATAINVGKNVAAVADARPGIHLARRSHRATATLTTGYFHAAKPVLPAQVRNGHYTDMVSLAALESQQYSGIS
jgi:hypothetical protein